MALRKVWIEQGCTVCGICADICPEVFEIIDEAIVKANINYNDFEAPIKEAAECCPSEVIRYD
jgi:ferredoxin